MSSTSNLKSTTTTTIPLDIVLVLDVSGSMDNGQGDSMGSVATYEEIYGNRLEGNRTYYVLVGDEYVAVEREGSYWGGYYWESADGTRYEPIENGWDDNQSHVQFYQRVNRNVNKMEALQSAANAFVDSVAELNDGITDTNNQHRISLVKFASDESNQLYNGMNGFTNDGYNRSMVMSDLTAYTTSTASSLKDTINDLYGEGATQADYGLHQAQRVLRGDGDLTGAREGAQKVVIFFTDGNPTSGSSWEDSVASNAVDYAGQIKDSGALIYSIGVVQGADPTDNPTSNYTSDINKFLHAVSSNYKDASYEYQYGWGGGDYEWSFGTRTTGAEGEPNPDYYFAANDADELDQVFEDITSSITDNLGSGSPIKDVTTGGAGGEGATPGTLTFTDTLGSYMEVTGEKMYLVFADGIHEGTTSDSGATWTFNGTFDANEVYPAGDLSTITVKVEKGTDLATGDTVTVEIPASLIPMRHYNVDTDNNTMTVSDAYPIRLFYGVSLKQDAVDALNDPTSEDYSAIMASQASEETKTVDFYSNSFTENAADGSTTAQFTPSQGNKFYYYTENTQLYLNQECTQPATRNNSGGYDTLYYKDTYWALTGTGDGAEEVDGYGTVTRGSDDWDSITWGDGTTQAFIPAHTERAERPHTLTSAKDQNNTDTATNVLNPAWADTDVVQHLGNNGKLSLDMPGSFEIKKTVDWGNASDSTKQNHNEFTFEVTLTDASGAPLTGNYPYYVGGSTDSAGTVTNGGTITIEGGQSVEVTGLPAGASFTVTEQGANTNGFTTTDSTAQQGIDNSNTTDGTVKGTIEAGTQISVSFTNTYHAKDVNLNAHTTLKVQKVLKGRDWRDTDSFDFTISGFRAPTGVTSAPLPEETTVTVDAADADQYTASFGDITYSVPGEYRYLIQEVTDPEQPIAGISPSEAIYRVIVMVGDNGTGSLTIDSVTIDRLLDDKGDTVYQETGGVVTGEPVQGNTATFTNTYDADVDTEGIQGVKSYNDTTGDNGFEPGKFQFQLEAKGGYETNGGGAADLTISAADTPMPATAQNNIVTTGNVGDTFTFPEISFDGNDVGNTYVYEVTELAGNEQGMNYDTTTAYTVQIKVEEVTDADGTHIVATVLEPYDTPANVKFSNEYNPEDAEATIHGTKTLTGRDMLEGETFYFQLTATNDNARSVLPSAETVTVTKNNMQNGSADFNFGDLSFSKVGTYTFSVNEVTSDGQGGYTETANGSGMTYDTNICTVTVTVTDGNDSDNPADYGKLLASVSYNNDSHAAETGKALFENAYTANMSYGAKGGIHVTKQLTNRPMTAGEFQFSITGVNSDTVTADAATAKLADADKSFGNDAAAANHEITMLKLQSLAFTQADAGKTYSYLVDETTEDNADTLPGVTCDQTQYRVDIEVVDNGNGTMHTVTTVTKTKDAQGNNVAADAEGAVVVDHANSDAPDYTAPTFGFVNEYNPEPVDAGEGTEYPIQVTKTVTGAPSPEGVSYGFTLTATGDNIANITGLDSNSQLHVNTTGVINQDATDGTGDDSQTLDFGKLTFSKPGTYTFTVQEDAPAADAGWTFDTKAKTITVEVTDLNEDGAYDGKLYIQSVNGSPAEVENYYVPESVIVGGEGAEQQITVQKSVTGSDSAAEFSFEIEPVDPDDAKWNNVAAVDPNFDGLASIKDGVTQAQAKTVSFAGIEFKAEGVYQFKVTEVQAHDEVADPNGWTYDTHEVTVKVTVTDTDFDGKLEAAVSYDNSSATTDADKRVTDAAAFTNSYQPHEVTTDSEAGTAIQVTKSVTGAPATEAFEFSLSLAVGQDGANVFEGTGDSKTAFDGMTVMTADNIAADDTETKTFDDITFTAVGNYKFVIDETTPQPNPANGWDYDDNTVEVTVHVEDQGGNLVITGIDNNNRTFTNSYAPAPGVATGTTALQLTKEVTGAPALSDFDFEVKLTSGDINNVKLGSGDNLTGFADAGFTVSTEGLFDEGANTGKQDNETVDFGDITFTATGDYTFTVTETTTTDTAGWTYATGAKNAKTITVHVTDDGFDGQLDVAVDDNNPTFTNKYESGSITTGANNGINVQKTLTGRNWQDGDSFEFVLEAVDGAPMPEGDGNKVTITNASDPKTATFSGITYDTAGTYQYKVTETKGSLGGVTYDGHTTMVTVTIADEDFDGSLEVKSVVYDNSSATTDADKAVTDAAAFTNVYNASGELDGTDLTVTKSYTSNPSVLGDPWTAEDSFGFTLEADTSDPATQTAMDNGWITLPGNAGSSTQGGITVTQDSEKYQASFGNIKFTKAGTYKFKVYEVLPEGVGESTDWTKDGIVYDYSVKTVTVNVSDNGNGTLTADVAEGSDALTFNNVYSVKPVMFRAAYFKLQGNKVLEGRNWEQGDIFAFTLTAGAATINGQRVEPGDPIVQATLPKKTTDTIEPLADGTVDDGGSWVSDNSAQFTFTDERHPVSYTHLTLPTILRV